jgi:hypothetical protein
MISRIPVRMRETIARPGGRVESTGATAYTCDNRASWNCSVRFASPSYQEALPSCAYSRKITPSGILFDPHVP